MYEVRFTTTYKKSYKLMKKRGLDLSLLDEVVDTLRQGKTLEEKYRDHGLSGKFQGFRSPLDFHPDLRQDQSLCWFRLRASLTVRSM